MIIQGNLDPVRYEYKCFADPEEDNSIVCVGFSKKRRNESKSADTSMAIPIEDEYQNGDLQVPAAGTGCSRTGQAPEHQHKASFRHQFNM